MFSGDDLNSDMPTTERIPSVLMEPFLGKGHILFTDNYYTSPSLASFLDNHTHLCGTIHPNRRHYPTELVKTNIQESEAVFYMAKNGKAMLACKYRSHKDKKSKQPKIVHMLSTCSQTNLVDTWKTDADGNAVRKPALIREYNLHMGDVDHVDQQLHNVSPLWKVYKWYKNLAFRITMQIILNAQKIYAGYTGAKMHFRNFPKTVITSWITIEQDPQPGHIVLDGTVSWLTGCYFSALLLPKPNAKDQQPSKRCRVCKIRTSKLIMLQHWKHNPSVSHAHRCLLAGLAL